MTQIRIRACGLAGARTYVDLYVELSGAKKTRDFSSIHTQCCGWPNVNRRFSWILVSQHTEVQIKYGIHEICGIRPRISN